MTQTAATAPAYTVTDLPGGERNLTGLARVSTDGQDAQLQRDALAAAGAGRIYEEKISARKAVSDRAGLAAALAELRPGDTLTVWKRDRLGRPSRTCSPSPGTSTPRASPSRSSRAS